MQEIIAILHKNMRFLRDNVRNRHQNTHISESISTKSRDSFRNLSKNTHISESIVIDECGFIV